MASRRVVCALAALVLALPSAAWAQGAGDEQYQDPFGDEGGQTEPEDGAQDDSQSGGQDDSQGGAPAGDEGEVAPAAPEAAPAQPAQSAPAEQLPYTGADTALVGLGGALLLAGGVALRVRLSERRPLSR